MSWEDAYPWSQEGIHLCRALADATLWCRVFPGSSVRRCVKATAKRLHRQSRPLVLSANRDEQFGGIVLNILATRSSRQCLLEDLATSFGKSPARRIADFIAATLDPTVLPPLTEIAEYVEPSAPTTNGSHCPHGNRRTQPNAAKGSRRGCTNCDPSLVRYAAPVPHTRVSSKVERNAPCPCGSGKKFKKCCERATQQDLPVEVSTGAAESASSSPAAHGGPSHPSPTVQPDNLTTPHDNDAPAAIRVSQHRLLPERLSHWLSRNELSEPTLLALTRLVAAFCIARPSRSRSYAEALARDPRFTLLMAEHSHESTTSGIGEGAPEFQTSLPPPPSRSVAAPVANRSEDDALASGSEGNGGSRNDKPTKAPSGVSMRPLQLCDPIRAELARVLSIEGDLERSVPVESLRAATTNMRALAERLQDQFRVLDETSSHARKLLLELKEASWLAEARLLWPAVSTDATPLAIAIKTVEGNERTATRLLEQCDQLNVLVERLGETTTPVLRGDIQPHDALSRLRELAIDFSAQLERKSKREQAVAEFVGRLSSCEVTAAHQMAAAATADLCADLAVFIASRQPCTSTGRPYKDLIGRGDVFGLVLARLWRLSEASAQDVAKTSLASVSWDPRQLQQALHHLSYSQMALLVSGAPELESLVSVALVVGALLPNRNEGIAHLEQIVRTSQALQPKIKALIERLIEASHRGQLRTEQLTPFLQEKQGGPSAADGAKRSLLNLIEHPGMQGKNFKRLRLVARRDFLLPLKTFIDSGRREEAWKRWAAAGDTDRKLKTVVARSGIDARELDEEHLRQTRVYLATFAAQLESWCHGPTANALPADIREALQGVSQDAELKPDGECAYLLKAMRRVLLPIEDQSVFTPTFGDGCDAEGRIEVDEGIVDPRMTHSWSQGVSSRRSALTTVLAERIRLTLGVGPQSLRDAVDALVSIDAFEAAQRAAEGDPAAAAELDTRLAARRAAIRKEAERLLADAKSNTDESVTFCIAEFESCVENLDFQAAREWCGEIENELRRARLRDDPEQRRRVALLKEAGEVVRDDTPPEELEGSIARLKEREVSRRAHVLVLQRASHDPKTPPVFKRALDLSIARVDRPSRWPSESDARRLASVTEFLVQFVHAKAALTGHDAHAVSVILERLETWLPDTLGDALGDAGDPELRQRSLAALDGLPGVLFHPLPKVMEALGLSPSFAATPMQIAVPTVGTITVSPRSGAREPAREVRRSSAEVMNELRRALCDGIASTSLLSGVPERRLLAAAIRRGSWQEARSLAAALLQQLRESEPAADSESVRQVEAVFAIVWACSVTPEDSDFGVAHETAALSTLIPTRTSEFGYFFQGSAVPLEITARGLIALAGEPTGNDLRDKLSRVLDELAHGPQGGRAYDWLAELLWKGAQLETGGTGALLSGRIAEQLWDCLKGGARDSARSRADLLHVLFRLKRLDSLRHLAQLASQVESLVTPCITAFGQAESDPTVRAQALELSATLRENARGPNYKPWTLIFSRLESTAGPDSSVPVVDVVLDSDLVDEDENGNVLLDVRLCPTQPGDPPESLEIELGGAGTPTRHVLLDARGDYLLKERVLQLKVPREKLGARGTEVSVPYMLTGSSIRGARIDLRGTWTFESRGKAAFAAPIEVISAAWPGATGDPVTRQGGFYGREAEIRRIENLLRAPNRQRSVMVFGQRRIGKTSLLFDLLRSHPPQRGGLCGAFVDLQGLDVPREPGGMQRRLFDEIVTALDVYPENEPIRHEIERHQGRKAEIAKLARNMFRDSLAPAIEKLVERLGELTNGNVSRVALLVDEFDKFVEPLLSGRRDEVSTLLWSLRQIVQRSSRVSLVLAGSGLQRLLNQSHNDAFSGSIDEVEVRPFEWESDHAAIANTFLPTSQRDALCDKDQFSDVIRQAHLLCGGHPFFLSMLGYASAVLTRGRRLTAQIVNRVAADMIRGRPELGRIDRKRFYMETLFATLESRLPGRLAALCKIMFAHISQHTTVEFPWLHQSRAVHVPGLPAGISESERLDAIMCLEREFALEIDRQNARCRVRVPLTAAAMREVAVVVREDALRDLRGTK